MELSHVGISQCFYCGGDDAVVIDTRLRKRLPHRAVYSYEPCPQCKGWMQKGIIFIEVDESKTTNKQDPYRVGGWAVLSEKAVRRIFAGSSVLDSVLAKRVAFIPTEVWELIGIPRQGVQS